MKLLRALAVAFGLLCGVVPFLGAISGLPPPVVIVYPLTASAGADPETGASIAVTIAQRLSVGGAIVVKPYPPGTQRADFLNAAKALGADYYISGFLTPLGDQLSMVTQVVSVASGTVITSSTAFVRTYADAAAQAEPLHDAILRHVGRALASLDAPPRETPAPNPSEKNEANISGLFKRKKKSAPAATPTPTVASDATSPPAKRVAQAVPTPSRAPATSAPHRTPRPTQPPRPPPTQRPTSAPAPLAALTEKPVALATARPSSGTLAKLTLAAAILVLDVAGDAGPTLSSYTQDSLVNAIGRRGTTVAGLPADPSDLPGRAREFCALAFGAKTLYAPTLTLDLDRNGAPSDVELDVISYDCAGTITGRQHARAHIGNRGTQTAVDRASADAVGAFAFASQGS